MNDDVILEKVGRINTKQLYRFERTHYLRVR